MTLYEQHIHKTAERLLDKTTLAKNSIVLHQHFIPMARETIKMCAESFADGYAQACHDLGHAAYDNDPDMIDGQAQKGLIPNHKTKSNERI